MENLWDPVASPESEMRRPSLIALVAITVLIIGAALPAQASDPIGENGVMVILIVIAIVIVK